MSNEVNNMQDVIDSRDVIARIEELEAEREEHIESEGSHSWVLTEEAAELNALESLAKEASDYAADWEYGEALIRDSYLMEYVIEMLQDCGDLPAEIPHYFVIDEEATARNIQMDYTAVDFDGVTYWIR